MAHPWKRSGSCKFSSGDEGSSASLFSETGDWLGSVESDCLHRLDLVVIVLLIQGTPVMDGFSWFLAADGMSC
jgi:hypothetical protein